MKILFLSVPFTWAINPETPPIGIADLSAVAKKSGYNAKAIDMWKYNEAQVKEAIKKEAPDVIGTSCMTTERFSSYKLVKWVKEVNPKIKVIVGGSHASCFPEQVFKLSPADVIVMGEGEETMLELLDAFEKDKTDLSNIKGIAFMKNGKLVKTEPRPFIKNLDKLPFPAYEDFDLKNYVNRFPDDTTNPKYKKLFKKLKGISVMTSRGCPWRCAFCSITTSWKRTWRARSPKNTVDLIEHLYKNFGIRMFNFFDDNFNVDNRRVIEICREIIKRKLKIYWNVQARVDTLNEETLRWMKKAGCYLIRFGVESGSQTILDNLQKDARVESIIKVFKIIKKVGLESNVHIIVGNPGENEKTINETINLIKIVKPDMVSTFGLFILPGTPLYERAKKEGLIDDNYWQKDSEPPLYTGSLTEDQIRMYVYKIQSSFEKGKGTLNYIKYLARNIKARINRPGDILKYGIKILKTELLKKPVASS